MLIFAWLSVWENLTCQLCGSVVFYLWLTIESAVMMAGCDSCWALVSHFLLFSVRFYGNFHCFVKVLCLCQWCYLSLSLAFLWLFHYYLCRWWCGWWWARELLRWWHCLSLLPFAICLLDLFVVYGSSGSSRIVAIGFLIESRSSESGSVSHRQGHHSRIVFAPVLSNLFLFTCSLYVFTLSSSASRMSRERQRLTLGYLLLSPWSLVKDDKECSPVLEEVSILRMLPCLFEDVQTEMMFFISTLALVILRQSFSSSFFFSLDRWWAWLLLLDCFTFPSVRSWLANWLEKANCAPLHMMGNMRAIWQIASHSVILMVLRPTSVAVRAVHTSKS